MTAANVSPMPAPKPKKASARAAEAVDGYVTVTQCGVELKIPMAGKIPLKAVIAFGEGDNSEGTQLLLGPEQWNAFLEKDPTLDDFEAIGNQLQDSSGN